MEKTKMKCASWAGPIILVCLLFLAVSWEASAQGSGPTGASYNVAASLKDNLAGFTGKDVYVNLRSGKVYQGYVKSVGDHLVHLEKIAGKDFYDALIRIEDISAIEVKMRGLK